VSGDGIRDPDSSSARNAGASAAREPAADASLDCSGGADRSRGPGNTAAASTGCAPFDWREGLEERDPQLAAFLAELAREKSDGRADRDGTSEEHGSTPGAATVRNSGSDVPTARSADTGSTQCGDTDGSTDDATPFPHRRLDELLAGIGASEGFAWLAAPATTADTGPTARLHAYLDQLEAADPFTVDARLREVRLVQQRIDAELASLLREAVDGRLYRELGFKSLESYVEARLGLCPRTAWTLLAIERASARRSPALARAWADGRISSLAARALLPVVGHHHDDAWITRARTLTLRRLEAEVAWTLDRIGEGKPAEPPPVDLDLAGAPLAGLTVEELQMRAHPAPAQASGSGPDSAEELKMRAHPAPAEPSGSGPDFAEQLKMRAQPAPDMASIPCAQVTFFAPQSVIALAEETMMALRIGSEPRGSAFERMLALAMLEWMAAPAHRDPVFARDGWRCAVPGCSSRRNLHDHHVVFRSHGGDNAHDNRITVCAAHHLHGLHRGRIRAHGAAPHGVVWELGIRFGGGEPLARLHGDRYLDRHGGAP